MLLAGATSVVGRAVHDRLADHEVRVLSRSAGQDVTRPESLQGVCEGVDVVMSLVGASLSPVPRFPDTAFDAVDRQGNLNLLHEAVRAGVPRFVYLSVFGPDDENYVRCHRDVEAALDQAPLTSTSVRPTGFFGSLEMLRAPGRLGLGARLGDGLARTNPIHEEDLADVLVQHLVAGPPIVSCGGPEVLTRRAINARLGARRHLPVPAALVRLQGRLLGTVNPRIGDLTTFLAYILSQDCIAPAVGTRVLS